MMLGLDDNEKKLMNALNAAGADMSVVKPWLKVYDRTRKNAVSVMGDYYRTRDALSHLIDELKELEAMMIGYEELAGDRRNRFADILRDMNKSKGSFDNDFVLSKEDKDFHLTLDSVCSLGPKYLADHENGLILHSEIENLISLSNEGMERERPDLFALSYFYINHKHSELDEMTFSEKVSTVMAIFNNEFLAKIETQLIYAINQAEAMRDRYEGSGNRKSDKLLSELAPLLMVGNDRMTTEEKARIYIREICKV